MNGERIVRLAAMFESMAPQDVERLGQWYCEDARFKDPFNDVQGLDAIQRVYRHMFEELDAPRFVVTRHIGQGTEWVLLWEFHFALRTLTRRPQVIRGASHLRLAPDGRIALHRDYWDAAEELYAKLPVIGAIVRWLRRRASATLSPHSESPIRKPGAAP